MRTCSVDHRDTLSASAQHYGIERRGIGAAQKILGTRPCIGGTLGENAHESAFSRSGTALYYVQAVERRFFVKVSEKIDKPDSGIRSGKICFFSERGFYVFV